MSIIRGRQATRRRVTFSGHVCRSAAPALLWTLAGPLMASGQSLLERTPNMGGTWIGSPGSIHFHFMHRFDATDPPTRKVGNTPTFLLALPLPGNTLAGARYATNSVLATGFPNEWEFFGRYGPLRQSAGAPLDLALHAAYNQAAASWDAELALARELAPLRLHGALRAFSDFQRQDDRWAIAGGAVVGVHEYIALAGDVATLVNRKDEEKIAWSAGVQLQIPTTPHTLSLHLANTHTTTLQGASLGTIGGWRFGFEFTVPFTFARLSGSRSPAAVDGLALPPPSAADTVQLTMTNQLAFAPAAIRVRVGQTVRWTNSSALPHTVTADPDRAATAANVRLPAGAAAFDSGNLQPGAVFTHTFDVPGEYAYVCLPHEPAGMLGRIIVEP